MMLRCCAHVGGQGDLWPIGTAKARQLPLGTRVKGLGYKKGSQF